MAVELTNDLQYDVVRQFNTGATRSNDANELDYEGFLSPIVLKRFAEYMHKHRFQKDGSVRDSDNWQKGMPRKRFMKSLWRHVMDLWLIVRNHDDKAREPIEDTLCAIMFNAMGFLHEVLVGRDIE